MVIQKDHRDAWALEGLSLVERAGACECQMLRAYPSAGSVRGSSCRESCAKVLTGLEIALSPDQQPAAIGGWLLLRLECVLSDTGGRGPKPMAAEGGNWISRLYIKREDLRPPKGAPVVSPGQWAT